jgi:hypothetical protein
VSAPSLLTGPYSTVHRAFSTAYTQARRATVIPIAITDAEALDTIDRLALSLADLCSTAVDPLAIVAGLEAEGYSDRAAREQFGLPDLFALADELHRRVPRELNPPDPRVPRPPATARALLRGLLFAAPALCGVTFLVTTLTGPARAALAAVQVLAWGYGQGIAHLAYARLGNGETGAARRVLRLGTATALLTAAGLFGLIELLLGTPARDLAPAAITLGFCLAAVPALVLGAEYRLAGTLVPTVLGASATLVNASAAVAPLGGAISAAAATCLAFGLTRHPPIPRPFARRDLGRATPHLLSGLGTGTLLTVVLAGPAAGHGLAALHAAMVLTLAMGAGEWHARWYQRHVEALLAIIADPADFPRRATAFLLVALIRQTATAGALAALGFILFDRSDRGAAGLYLFAVALAPGLLASLFLRAVDATAALWPTVLTLLATLAAVPERNTAVLAALAVESTILTVTRAAAATSRPWVHL